MIHSHHPKPFRFFSLPAEIRVRVLRNLLLSDGEEVPAQEDTFWGDIPVQHKNLHPSILRVCKQMNNEGFNILYQENVFKYRCQLGFYGEPKPWNTRRFNTSKFSEIKHISTDFVQHTLPVSGQAISFMLKHLATLGCSLKTLKLCFYIRAWKLKEADYESRRTRVGQMVVWEKQPSECPVDRTAARRHILQDLSALGVQRNIEVYLHQQECASLAGRLDTLEFQAIVDAISEELGWRVTMTREGDLESSEDLEIACTEQVTSWVLRPAPATAQPKSPPATVQTKPPPATVQPKPRDLPSANGSKRKADPPVDPPARNTRSKGKVAKKG